MTILDILNLWSLKKRFHDCICYVEHKGDQLLTWPARFNICVGVAHGLNYLHAGVHPRIIHRDIKANNVLLDSNLQPKIADFGLAMLNPNEETHITIVQVAGTK